MELGSLMNNYTKNTKGYGFKTNNFALMKTKVHKTNTIDWMRIKNEEERNHPSKEGQEKKMKTGVSSSIR